MIDLLAAQPLIRSVLDGTGSSVFRYSDLNDIWWAHRKAWKIRSQTGIEDFIAFLLQAMSLRKQELHLSPHKITLYVWGDVSPYVVATAINPKAYICHRTAMHLHGLADDTDGTIYVNHEQKPVQPSGQPLTQQAVDNAFRANQRLTNNRTPLGEYDLCVLNGKFTDRLGVLSLKDKDGRPFPATCIERTLIDATVRPAYAGGPAAVLNAYRRARERVSLSKLDDTLQQMQFVYPYEQAVGFYLQRAGWPLGELDDFRRRPFGLNFYLAHGMKKPLLDESWKVYYPRDLS